MTIPNSDQLLDLAEQVESWSGELIAAGGTTAEHFHCIRLLMNAGAALRGASGQLYREEQRTT